MASSFWSNYRQPDGNKRFESLIRPLEIEPLPTHRATQKDIPALLAFLERHFGDPPKTPVLRPVLDPSKEIILFVQEAGDIQATIRYKYAGRFEGRPIHIIDCFCARTRGTGLATKLLATLHHHTNDLGLRYSLFLKEGRPLPTLKPLYSSTYVFRALKARFKPPPLSPQIAERLVATYRQLHPDTVWIYDVRNANQHWLFWKEGREWILLCVQDSYQWKENGRIGWITACFASEPMRSDAFEALVDQAPFDWVWMDRVWLSAATGAATGATWITDGPFHWYLYQWSTNLQVGRFYGIVV